MKYAYLLLVIIIVFVQCGARATEKPETKKIDFKAVFKGSYNSVVSETGHQCKDSIYNFLFEVKLINNSVVPVRFLTSSCSTVQYIVLDSRKVRLWINNCARNSITVIELNPYQQFIFPVVLQTEVKFAYSEFRMGYVLLSPEIKIESVYNELFRNRENFENVVWSDTIRLQPLGGQSYYEIK